MAAGTLGRTLELCAAAVVICTTPLTAQPEEGHRPMLFGFWVGGELLPRGVDHTCLESHSMRGIAGANLLVPLFGISLEGRLDLHWRSGEECVFAPIQEPGTYTSRMPQLPGGGFATLDARMRWSPSRQAVFFVAAGAGWAGGPKDVPYVSAGMGAQSRETPKLGVEIALDLYRVPWEERTVVVDDDLSTTTTLRRPYKDWAPAVGIRFSVELPMSTAGS